MINIYRDPAVATQILPLRFTVDNLKTQILCGIIERQIIGIPTDFLFLCDKRYSSHLIDLVEGFGLNQLV